MTEKEKADERYSRAYLTKLGIAKAMNDLCKTTAFDSLRVETIIEAANCSRSSFYHHFTDKNDAVNWISLQCYTRGIDQIGRKLTWFEGHLATTKAMGRFSDLFVSAKDGNSYDSARPFFIRHRQENLTETLVDFQHREMTDVLAFQIEALPHVEMVMSNNFIRGKYDFGIKEFCRLIITLVPPELYSALAVPSEGGIEAGDLFFA